MNTIKHKIAEMIPNHLFFLDLVEDHSNSKIKIIVDGLSCCCEKKEHTENTENTEISSIIYRQP